MKGIIIYKSKYGATQQYAEWIARQLGLPMADTDSISSADLVTYDLLIIGASVYIGKLLLKDWISKHRAALQGKNLFLFIVCGTPASQGAKQRQILENNIPQGLFRQDKVFFLPGRLRIQQLSWRDRLLLKMGARLEKDPHTKAAMLQDIDGVTTEQLEGLLQAARQFIPETILP